MIDMHLTSISSLKQTADDASDWVEMPLVAFVCALLVEALQATFGRADAPRRERNQ